MERVAVEAGGVVSGPIQRMGHGGFVGERNGPVDLGRSDESAEEAFGEIPGPSPAEVAIEGPEGRKDAIGELTRMTVGGCKHARGHVGDPGTRTRPTSECGQAFKVGAIKGAARHMFRFECRGHPLVADRPIRRA